MTCGCEYGPKCTTVSRCTYEELLDEYARQFKECERLDDLCSELEEALASCAALLVVLTGPDDAIACATLKMAHDALKMSVGEA